MTQNVAVRAEKVRDLRKQVAELAPEDEPEILFQSISPGRQPVTVYSTENGEAIAVPAYMIGAVMEKTLPPSDEFPDGRAMFVADKKDAPEYKPGTVKCFLHKDSPDRAILEEIGLSAATCSSDHLGSLQSKRIHGLHRHKQEWAAYQEFVENAKEEKREARQEKQLEATLTIARGNAAQTAAATPLSECGVEGCNYTGTKRQLAGHKMGAHKENGNG